MLGNKVAVVTGAGQGIGKAITEELASNNTIVYAVDRNGKALEAVAKSVSADVNHVLPEIVDLASDDNLYKLVNKVQSQYNRLDILIHCAAEYRSGMIADSPVKDLDDQYRTNVRSIYLLTQLLLPLLKAHNGQIVFMNSSQGMNARPGHSQYAATKHALKAFADSLRNEVNPHGVRVLSVFAGRTATPLMKMICEMEGSPFEPEKLLQPEDIASVVINALALPKTAEVTDLSIRPLVKR